MSVRVIVMPTGEKATSVSIEAWKRSAQEAANQHHSQIELRTTDPETGAVLAHLIADPEEPGPGMTLSRATWKRWGKGQ